MKRNILLHFFPYVKIKRVFSLQKNNGITQFKQEQGVRLGARGGGKVVSADNIERFLRSSETDLKIPLVKMISGLTAFSYRGAKQWNRLEREIRLGTLPENLQRIFIEGNFN